MSLTNPKKVVTEERLSAFYQELLPYLGGIPDLLANKFSKGDLYSTDEQMVGQWIDGKPLYQKTIDCGAIPNNSTKVIQHNIANIDTITNFDIIGITSGKISIKIPGEVTTANHTSAIGCYVSRNDIGFKSYDDRSGYNAYAIIQYTKTTDSAIAIGSDTDYSTEEKIIGTWIDGKPIYQKTILFGNLPNNSVKKVPIGVNNIDKIVDLKGIAIAENNAVFILPSSTCTNLAYAIECVVLLPSNEIQIITAVDRSTAIGYITVQYTKTS